MPIQKNLHIFVLLRTTMAKVFISYSKRDFISEDGTIINGSPVQRILSDLESAGISYWIDREGLDAGVTYAEKIARNIKECETFLFVSTENANSSDWTLREISSAISFGKKILPIRVDHSDYATSVALYLSSIQYIDWLELGADESLRRIVSKVKNPDAEFTVQQEYGKIPRLTTYIMYSGLVFLCGVYALLTYQFLWVKQLRSSEIMGGLVGFVCEFGVLMSIYYILRLLRRRRCSFVLPIIVVGMMFLAGMMLRDSDVVMSSVLLLFGWVLLFCTCFIKGKTRKSLWAQLSKEQILMKWTDAENLILVYLVIKCCILVFAHYFSVSMNSPLFSPYLF